MTELLLGNNKDLLEELEDESIDALVTDPPYLINFMGKDWDKENSPAGDKDFWALVLKKMKPGAHGVVFGHSRQHHRVMTALEDAGFEIRDCLMWLYGSGFPKSHNVGKAVGKLEGDSEWEGWGTALKPAYEPIILVRRPIEKKLTVAKNVLKHGVGGINIDASRVGSGDTGRFPANVMLSHHPDCKKVCHEDCPVKILDEQAPKTGGGHRPKVKVTGYGKNYGGTQTYSGPGPKMDGFGGASRFFYNAKVSKKERNAAGKNTHPTVKPIALMRYLVRLITPKGGKVLDPFMGSGSTGVAAVLEGTDFVGMEMNEEYLEIAKARMK